MNKKIIIYVLAASLMVLGVACTTNQRGYPTLSKQGVITILGAGAGALLGAQFGQGTGKLAMVALGTAAGGALGNWLSSDLDKNDKEVVNHALENQANGQSLPWKNNISGNQYSVTPVKIYRNNSGQYCREFTMNINVAGRTQQGFGNACRQPDGTWKILSMD